MLLQLTDGRVFTRHKGRQEAEEAIVSNRVKLG